MAVKVAHGRVFWNIREQKFVAEHFPSKGKKGFSRSETPRACYSTHCMDALKVGQKTNPSHHRTCWFEHIATKETLVKALQKKHETGEWGELLWREK